MIKFLTVLGVLQLAVMMFLVVQVLGLQEHANSSVADGAKAAISDTTGADTWRDHGEDLSEATLRRLMREEFAAQLAALSASSPAAAPGAVSETPGPLHDTGQLRRVDQQLAYHISTGTISESEMADLQREMAKLDRASRTAMLKKLTRALNSGSLDGRL